MPYVGRVGAISAANRRSKQSQRMKLSSARKYRADPVSTPAAAASADDISLSETDSCASTQSKSVIAQLRQQADKTGGLFKKVQSVMKQKVTKGFNMLSGKKNDGAATDELFASGCGSTTEPSLGQTNSTQRPPLTQTTTETVENQAASDPAWLASLEQMGFARSQIMEAIAIVGGESDSWVIDDMLQVLLGMNASSASSASSSPMPAPPVPPSVAPAPPLSAPPLLEESAAEIDVPLPRLSAVVVAMVLAQVSASMVSQQQHEDVLTNDFESAPLPVSPKRGGEMPKHFAACVSPKRGGA